MLWHIEQPTDVSVHSTVHYGRQGTHSVRALGSMLSVFRLQSPDSMQALPCISGRIASNVSNNVQLAMTQVVFQTAYN